MRFQKWMFYLHPLRDAMKNQPDDKRTKDDNTLIDFVQIYSDICPKMIFYKIENLYCHQGFDLISYLISDFKYLGLEFMCLPISYQSIFEKNWDLVSLVWWRTEIEIRRVL